MKIKRGDLIKVGDTQYIITEMEGRLYAWDFKAWADGFYDAYLGITGDWGYGILPLDEATKEGNIYDNPELLPSVCDGYNGEPSVVCIERIWQNPNLIEG